MDKQPLPTHDYRIRTKTDPTLTIPVHAAYFRRMDNEFLEFKDADQKTIYVIAIDAVLDVGRHDAERHALDEQGRRKISLNPQHNMVGEETLAHFKSELPKP